MFKTFINISLPYLVDDNGKTCGDLISSDIINTLSTLYPGDNNSAF